MSQYFPITSTTLGGAFPAVELAATGVIPTTYGSATAAAVFMVNSSGQITSATTTNISVAGLALTSGNIWVGNGSNIATAVTMSGDAVISNSGALTISNGVITNAKLANSSITVTGGTGLGVSGSPVALGGTVTLSNTGVTSIIAGSGVTISGATGAVTINAGTVTSVGLTAPTSVFNTPATNSPITTAGTLDLTFITQPANTIFAGPTTGVSTVPTFRSLVFADIPSTSANTASTVVSRDASGNFSATTITATSFVGALTGNASTVTTNANLSGVITSVGNTTSWVSPNGTGNVVLTTSPTLTTPNIGAATGTSLSVTGGISGNVLTSTVSTGTAPLVVASTTQVSNLTATNTVNALATNTNAAATYYITFVGSNVTGQQGVNMDTDLTYNPSTNTLTAATFVGTLSGNATTATSATTVTTNANLSGVITSAGNVTSWVSPNGTGNVVLTTSPTLTTPNIGAATGTSLSVTGGISGNVLTSTVSTGTAPLVVASTTQVSNLTATNTVNTLATNTNAAATYYITFVGSNVTGQQGMNMDTDLTYNPSTNTLTATSFVGALTGNATTATTATTATNVTGTVNIVNGGTGLTALGTANQILGVNTGGTSLEYKTVTGTSGNINVTPAAGSINVNLPTIGTITPGNYVNTNLTVDAQGRITLISNGTGGGGGTVSSVGLAAPAEFTVSGSPVTSSGVLTLTKAVQNANTLWSGPTSGGSAVPVFRVMAVADLPINIPNSNLENASITVTGGTGLGVSGSPVSLGGTVTMSNTGVTSAVSLSANQVLVSAATGAVTFSLPQDIATTSSPTFNNLILSNQLQYTNGVEVGNSSSTASDSSSIVIGKTSSANATNSIAIGGSVSAGSISPVVVQATTTTVGLGTNNWASTGHTYQSIIVSTTFILGGLRHYTGTIIAGSITWEIYSGVLTSASLSGLTLLGSIVVTSTPTPSYVVDFSSLNITLTPGTYTVGIPATPTSRSWSATSTGVVDPLQPAWVSGFPYPHDRTFIVDLLNVGDVGTNSVAIGQGSTTTANGAVALGRNITANMNDGFFVRHRNVVTPTAARIASYDNTSNELVGLPYAGGAGYILTSDSAGVVAWAAPSGVTSVGLAAPAEFTVSGSPVTSSGVLTLTKAVQTANTLWSGPTSGGSAEPGFRTLVVADLPTNIPNSNLQNSSITVTGGTGLGVSGSPISLGGMVTLSNTGVTSAVSLSANQVLVSAATGAVTFSLPQDIATTSSPTFNNLILSNQLQYTNGVEIGNASSSTTDSSNIVIGKTSTANVTNTIAIGGSVIAGSSSPLIIQATTTTVGPYTVNLGLTSELYQSIIVSTTFILGGIRHYHSSIITSSITWEIYSGVLTSASLSGLTLLGSIVVTSTPFPSYIVDFSTLNITLTPGTYTVGISAGLTNRSIGGTDSGVVDPLQPAWQGGFPFPFDRTFMVDLVNGGDVGTNSVAIGQGSTTTANGAVALGSNITANMNDGFFVRHRNAVTPTAARIAAYNDSSNELVGLPYAGGAGYILTSDPAGVVSWIPAYAAPTIVSTTTYSVLAANTSLIVRQAPVIPVPVYTTITLLPAAAVGRELIINNPIGAIMTSSVSNIVDNITFSATISGSTLLTLNSSLYAENFVGMVISGFGVTPGTAVTAHAGGTYGATGSTYTITSSTNTRTKMTGVGTTRILAYPSISKSRSLSLVYNGSLWHIVSDSRKDNFTLTSSSVAGTQTNQFAATYDGTNVWFYGGNGNANYLQRFDTATNAVTSFSPGGVGQNLTVDMEFDGTYLWVPQNPIILFNVATQTSTVSSINLLPGGILYAGGFMWIASNLGSFSGTLYKYNPTTYTLIASYSGAGTVTPGLPTYECNRTLTYDGTYIYTGSQSMGVVNKINASTMSLAGIYSIGRNYIGGVAGLTFDGTNVWAVGSNTSGTSSTSLMKIDTVLQTMYNVGTAASSGGGGGNVTITGGGGATFIPAMVGGTIQLANGLAYYITGFISSASMTAYNGDNTALQGAQAYQIWYGNTNSYYNPTDFPTSGVISIREVIFDGIYINVVTSTNAMYQFSRNGILVNTITANISTPWSAVFDGTNIWIGNQTNTVAKISPTFT